MYSYQWFYINVWCGTLDILPYHIKHSAYIYIYIYLCINILYIYISIYWNLWLVSTLVPHMNLMMIFIYQNGFSSLWFDMLYYIWYIDILIYIIRICTYPHQLTRAALLCDAPTTLHRSLIVMGWLTRFCDWIHIIFQQNRNMMEWMNESKERRVALQIFEKECSQIYNNKLM